MAATYKVNGMTCGGCARAVENAIKEEIPGAQVSIEVASGKVTVEGACSAEKIERAVTEAGFEFAGAL